MTTTPMKTWPALYKITSTGATQTWEISVEGSTIITLYGQLGGKIQEARDTITVGKNIGRANETTPEQQARAEAQSQWEKKLKNKGYVQSLEAAASGEADADFVAGGINPMLAQPFSKHGHKITFPAYTQPKLDGHRCIATVSDGVATLWTRTRKPITSVPHIIAALEAANLPDMILDGELYNHAYRDRFAELTSFIKRPVPKPGHEVVQYHIYDMPTNWPFWQRWANLVSQPLPDVSPIVIVDTQLVADEDEAMDAFSDYIAQGYEGSMLRNTGGSYEHKRSYNLQKVKEFDDGEFLITNVEEGRGKMAGKAIFTCRLPNGGTFRVKMKGTLDSLTKYVENPSLALTKMLTVQYQGLTADGIPRFPVGLRIREDI